MDRRDFLKSAAVGAAGVLLTGKAVAAEKAVTAGRSEKKSGEPDLVAVRGGEPAALLDAALAEFGGIGRFVKSGDRVAIKPNIGWDQPPEMGANTNPELVGRLVELCMQAGAKEVYVFDRSCDNWVKSYATSGIRAAAEAAGARVVSGTQRDEFVEVDVKGARRMVHPKVQKLVLECDVFFNVPVLKHHGGAKLTCAMKNLMGIVWDRQFMHKNDLQQCIADAALIRRPDLNIVDAYRIMCSGGPRGNASSVIRKTRSLLASQDIVAVDTAAAKLIGFPTNSIRHLKNAEDLGLGTMALDRIDIRRIDLKG